MKYWKPLLPLCGLLLAGCTPDLQVGELSCEYRTDPPAVETQRPALGWNLLARQRASTQSAYRILVADRPELLDRDEGNVWDSGQVGSDESVHVAYSGDSLLPGRCYYWKVKAWDQEGDESPWSEPAMWRQVAPNPTFSWIGYRPATDRPDHVASVWFRRSYTLGELPDGPLYAEVATPGYYELYVNGQKVGSDLLSPSVSGRDRRTFYVSYDIRPLLQAGPNTVALWVGRGWSGTSPIPVAFRCDVPQADGSVVSLQTDSTWRARESHYATIGTWSWGNFGGECQDARRALAEWNACGPDDTAWDHAETVASPSPRLVAQPCELNRQQEFEPARSITRLDDGSYEIAFARALTGNYRVYFPPLKAGDTVVLHFADTRWSGEEAVETPAGRVATMGLRYTRDGKPYRYPTYNQRSLYVASGAEQGGEYIESKFNPLGFQYIVVEGLSEAPVRAEAALVESDLQRVGSFECSNELLTEMHRVNDWTMRCLNQGGFYVDCPQRERLGYGDGQVSIESSVMNYHMPSFYRKFVKDWTLRQNPKTGHMPHVAPNASGGGGPAWAGLVASAAWRNYLYYGDRTLLEEAYPAMYAYLKYLETLSVDEVYRSEPGKWNSIGDWLAPGRGMDTNNWPDTTMAALFNNCYIIYLWDLQRRSAEALGLDDEAAACARKIDRLRERVHAAYYDPERGCYVSDEQPYLLMPLMAGVVPDTLRDAIWQRLEANIDSRGTFQTGMLGTYFLLNFLQENDRNDLIYRLVNHTNYPGWGYMLSQGATTWWEQWNGYYSHIHSVFTSLDGWFYQGVAGIRPASTDVAGMKHFRLCPAYDLPLDTVQATTRSPYGTIRSDWTRRADGTLQLQFEVPANSTAEVWFRQASPDSISEAGCPLERVEGVTEVRREENRTVARIGSGSYCFDVIPRP